MRLEKERFEIDKYGVLINEIRIQKNLSLNYLISNIISKSQFYKFVSGESMISVSRFDLLLKRLSMSHEEFYFIYNKKFDDPNLLFSNIKTSFEEKNLESLEILKNQFKIKYRSTGNLQDNHLHLLCSILGKRIQNITYYDFELNIIKNYLLSIDEWSYYEITLLNNTMFIFDYETLNSIISILIKKTTNINVYKKNDSALLKVISNVLILNIHHNNYQNFDNIISFLKHFQGSTIDDKTMIYFWITANKYIKYEHNKYLKKLTTLLEWLNEIDMNDLSFLYSNILTNIQKTLPQK